MIYDHYFIKNNQIWSNLFNLASLQIVINHNLFLLLIVLLQMIYHCHVSWGKNTILLIYFNLFIISIWLENSCFFWFWTILYLNFKCIFHFILCQGLRSFKLRNNTIGNYPILNYSKIIWTFSIHTNISWLNNALSWTSISIFYVSIITFLSILFFTIPTYRYTPLTFFRKWKCLWT